MCEGFSDRLPFPQLLVDDAALRASLHEVLSRTQPARIFTGFAGIAWLQDNPQGSQLDAVASVVSQNVFLRLNISRQLSFQ